MDKDGMEEKNEDEVNHGSFHNEGLWFEIVCHVSKGEHCRNEKHIAPQGYISYSDFPFTHCYCILMIYSSLYVIGDINITPVYSSFITAPCCIEYPLIHYNQWRGDKFEIVACVINCSEYLGTTAVLLPTVTGVIIYRLDT